MLVIFPYTAVILRSNLVTVIAVNIEAKVPIVRVIAKPFIGPVPNWNNIAVIINVVTFPSNIAENALLNPASIAFIRACPFLNSSFILSNIANKIDSNIRELEGVFNKIVARASLTHSPITIELAENIINEFKYENEKVISCDFIKETVAKYFSINKDDLSGNKRSNDIAFPRQIAMYLCREVANMSYPQIGTDFGGRDHSTVMHACRKIEKEVKEKNNTKLIVDSVKNIIINGKQ